MNFSGLFLTIMILASVESRARAPLTEIICSDACKSSQMNVIYLHGLEPIRENFSDPRGLQLRNRRSLNQLSKDLGICFALVKAPGVCSQGTQRCWASANAVELLAKTVQLAEKTCFQGTAPDGLIGFSNGGFFLNRLYERCELSGVPWTVSIGSGTPKNSAPVPSLNQCGPLQLVVSRSEVTAPDARKYFQLLKGLNAEVELEQVPGGTHSIPTDFLMKFLSEHATR